MKLQISLDTTNEGDVKALSRFLEALANPKMAEFRSMASYVEGSFQAKQELKGATAEDVSRTTASEERRKVFLAPAGKQPRSTTWYRYLPTGTPNEAEYEKLRQAVGDHTDYTKHYARVRGLAKGNVPRFQKDTPASVIYYTTGRTMKSGKPSVRLFIKKQDAHLWN